MNKKTILFIEDDKDDLAFSIRAFKSGQTFLNYIIVAYDGIQAKEYLMLDKKKDAQRLSFHPSLIILDLKLPYIGGLDLLKGIKENELTRNIPVVIFTSSDNPKDLQVAYKLGVNSFVKKPENYEKFIETMKKIIDYWMDVNLTLSENNLIR